MASSPHEIPSPLSRRRPSVRPRSLPTRPTASRSRPASSPAPIVRRRLRTHSLLHTPHSLPPTHQPQTSPTLHLQLHSPHRHRRRRRHPHAVRSRIRNSVHALRRGCPQPQHQPPLRLLLHRLQPPARPVMEPRPGRRPARHHHPRRQHLRMGPRQPERRPRMAQGLLPQIRRNLRNQYPRKL